MTDVNIHQDFFVSSLVKLPNKCSWYKNINLYSYVIVSFYGSPLAFTFCIPLQVEKVVRLPAEDLDDGNNNDNNALETYVVDSFEDITCENQGEMRVLFKNQSPDTFTTVITTDRDENGVLAFESAVTAGFYSLGETSFSCEGTVDKSRGRNRNGHHWRRILISTAIDGTTNTKGSMDVVPAVRNNYISFSRRGDSDSGTTISTTKENKNEKIIAFASWWIGLAIVFGFTFSS